MFDILELDFANDEHLKIKYITLMWKQKMTPCYLVIHICTLSFLHSLIQKLQTILILDSYSCLRISDLHTYKKNYQYPFPHTLFLSPYPNVLESLTCWGLSPLFWKFSKTKDSSSNTDRRPGLREVLDSFETEVWLFFFDPTVSDSFFVLWLIWVLLAARW